MNALSFCSFIFVTVQFASAGNVLILPPLISASHKLPLRIWASVLEKLGHDVFWWSPSSKLDHYQPKESSKVHVEHFEVNVDDKFLMDAFRYENDSFIHDLWWNSRYAIPFIETMVGYQLTPFCESVLVNHKKSFEKVLSRKYDLIIVDEILNPCGVLMAQLADGPVVTYVSTSAQSRSATKSNGLPVPYSHNPAMGDLFVPTDRMNFWQRANTMFMWMAGYIGDYFYNYAITNRLQKYVHNLTDITHGLVRPHLQFLSVPKFFDLVLPLARNSIYMGGLQVPKSVQPLNEPYSTFVRSAQKGFVILSFGHWGNWNVAPEKIRQSFIKAFKLVPKEYSIIWQYNGPDIPDLPKNILAMKWIPMNSLLADPACKLLITHCGCNSLTEAGHHGVPLLAIPLSADQPDGAARAISKGFGVLLKKDQITTESLLKGILEVLQNESYSKNVKKYSRAQKSLPMTADETTAFWSEFVMKHNKKKDGLLYRTSLSGLNLFWFQFYCLDVIFVFTLFSIGIMYTLMKLFLLIRN